MMKMIVFMFLFMSAKLESESRATGASRLPVYSNSTPKSYNNILFAQPAFFFSARTNPSAAAGQAA